MLAAPLRVAVVSAGDLRKDVPPNARSTGFLEGITEAFPLDPPLPDAWDTLLCPGGRESLDLGIHIITNVTRVAIKAAVRRIVGPGCLVSANQSYISRCRTARTAR